jgi:hypothetical protein
LPAYGFGIARNIARNGIEPVIDRGVCRQNEQI